MKKRKFEITSEITDEMLAKSFQTTTVPHVRPPNWHTFWKTFRDVSDVSDFENHNIKRPAFQDIASILEQRTEETKNTTTRMLSRPIWNMLTSPTKARQPARHESCKSDRKPPDLRTLPALARRAG